MAAATSRHLTRTRVLRSRMLLTSKPQIVERETGFQFTFAIGLWHVKNPFWVGEIRTCHFEKGSRYHCRESVVRHIQEKERLRRQMEAMEGAQVLVLAFGRTELKGMPRLPPTPPSSFLPWIQDM